MLKFIVIVFAVFVLLVLFQMYRDSQKEKGKKWLETPLYSDNNFLGDAAEFKQQGVLSVKNKEYSKAWEAFHKQKHCFMKHADEHNFTAQQTSALDASVGENLANILRLEGKHVDALVHIIYWVSTSSRITKVQEKKLIAYFNRSKLNDVGISQVEKFIESRPEFARIKQQVSEWHD